MPNRYQREIEEILRNLDQSEPRQGIGERIRAFNRPRRPPRRTSTNVVTRSEAIMLVGLLLALAGAGWTFYNNSTPDVVTGVLALAGFTLIVLDLAGAWVGGRRRTSAPAWRNNVVDMRPPRHRNPFGWFSTQFRILRLRMRYRKKHDSRDRLND